MALDFRTTTINFSPSQAGQSGPQRGISTVDFDTAVQQNKAAAALIGFDIRYSDGEYLLFEEQIEAGVSNITGTTVEVAVNFAIRGSGGYLHRFGGRVEVLVIADVA